MPKAFLFFLFLLAADEISLHAQQVSKDSVRNYYIKEYPDHFFIWPVIKQRSLSFDISERNKKTQTLNYRPNSTFHAGVGLYLFEISIELSAAIPLNEKSKARYGDSDARDLQANILGKSWGLDVFSQRYSGFYLTDSRNPVANNQPYPQRSDIDVTNRGVNGLYIFNKKKFSLRSFYTYAERQLHSRGSIVLTGTVNNFRMDANETVLTPQFEAKVGTASSFKKLHYTTISLAPGYTHSFIYRHFFLNTTVSLGPAHHWIYTQLKDGSNHYDISINSYADVRIGLGYNSDRLFGGISFVNRARTVRFEEVQFTNSSSTLRMLIGYRFKEVGILKNRARDFIPSF